ncbi:MAG: P-loop NTPase fold protein [Minisyncoccia bacterium]
MTFEELAVKIEKLKPKHTQLVIGIDGDGGAGKTTFANKLAYLLDAEIIYLDDLYKSKKDRMNENQDSNINIDYDWKRIKKEIFTPIRESSKINYHYYDWNLDKITHIVNVPEGKNIIIEGSYSLQPKFFKDYDFSIYIETPKELRLKRAMIRDGEYMRSHWEKVWLPAYKRYKDTHKVHENVDLLIDGLKSDFENNIIHDLEEEPPS